MASSFPITVTGRSDRSRRASLLPSWALPGWTLPAWGAIGVTALFLAITVWWLTQDRSVPVFDAGLHLHLAFNVHHELASGRLGNALTLSIPYPPLAYLVGALGIVIGGINVASPILAENFVFVPLLALGCYHLGRLAFDSTTGLLAVIFALGSPLIGAQFHVFMIDAPETAMVAVSVWAILATERFSRVWISALAGFAVALGLLVKEPFVFFVAGPVVVTAIRGGRSAWRGILMFSLITLIVALPWYVHEFSKVEGLGTGAIKSANHPNFGYDIAPAPFSLDNFTWYFWSITNYQLYLPLAVFFLIGSIWTINGFVQRHTVSTFAPELVAGAFVGWLGITETFSHDTRYCLPLLVYMAVLGTGWISKLARRLRVGTVITLVTIGVLNTLGTSFGVGAEETLQLGPVSTSRQLPGTVKILPLGGFLVGAPTRDGDVLKKMIALKRQGITVLAMNPRFLFEADFSAAGLEAFAYIAGLTTRSGEELEAAYMRGLPTAITYVAFIHRPTGVSGPRPCITLSDGSSVNIGSATLGATSSTGAPSPIGKAREVCPSG